tara:strand:- start:1071 stop:1355 length:285 start_codon:yes stop_codon:yes gene_type:complete
LLNFTTNIEYTGQNIETLEGLGSKFCTFNQAKKYFNIDGKLLKGAKSCARLVKVVEKEVFNKNGAKEKKKVPVYFSVFEKKHLIKVIKSNGGVA